MNLINEKIKELYRSKASFCESNGTVIEFINWYNKTK